MFNRTVTLHFISNFKLKHRCLKRELIDSEWKEKIAVSSFVLLACAENHRCLTVFLRFSQKIFSFYSSKNWKTICPLTVHCIKLLIERILNTNFYTNFTNTYFYRFKKKKKINDKKNTRCNHFLFPVNFLII